MNDREMSCNSGGQFMDRGRMNQNGVVQPLLTGKYDFAFTGVMGLSHLVAKIYIDMHINLEIRFRIRLHGKTFFSP